MQEERFGSLIQANRRGRPGRRGLEAIFTPQNEERNTDALLGAAGIIGGLVLSTLAVFQVEYPQALAADGQAIYSPLIIGSIGLLLLTCGGGTVIFALTYHGTGQKNAFASQSTGTSEANFSGDASAPGGVRSRGFGSRIGVVAFIQSLVLVALYSGLVQEYESNTTMQSWVRSSFPVGQSVFSWEAVLVFSVALGMALLQFLEGRLFSE